MALTPKQQRFVDEYLIDLNATQAAIRAGYSETSARQVGAMNMTKHDIAEAIADKQGKLQQKTEITQEWVLQNLKIIAERCMQTEAVFDKDGQIIEYRFDSSGANKSLETIGKHLGMFKDKLEITGNLSIESVLKDI